MAKKRKLRLSPPALILGGLAVVLLILVIVFFTGGGGEKVRRLTGAGEPKPRDTAATRTEMKTVTLFFLSDDDDLLHKETREIAAGPTTAEEAERALAELVKGSEKGFLSPLPPQTKIRQVFIDQGGTAIVDFSRDVAENYAYGSSSELSAVYAVVDTLSVNFKAVKKVRLLVEGAERETLGGHVDLTRAFLPDYSIVAR